MQTTECEAIRGMGGIFISYRREEAAPWAGPLYERLAREFPRNQLFMDVAAIEPGLDFVTVLEQQLSGCDVLLAIIGPTWVEARHKERRHRAPVFCRTHKQVRRTLRRRTSAAMITLD